jgi:hypothetical protein
MAVNIWAAGGNARDDKRMKAMRKQQLYQPHPHPVLPGGPLASMAR